MGVSANYQVEITRGGADPASVAAESGEQILVPWPAAPLTARETATVRVRVQGAGDWSGWSEPATVEVRAAGFRISTGFVGTPLVTDALADAGEPELAYRLLLQTGCPSWLYPVTMGATTVRERWDSMLPDGRINPGEMTSFNHYALGAVADWLHRRVAGLAPAEPGYRRLDVSPLPSPRLTRAEARHLTPYGEASVSWERAGGRLRLRVTVPVPRSGCRAAVNPSRSGTGGTSGRSTTRTPGPCLCPRSRASGS